MTLDEHIEYLSRYADDDFKELVAILEDYKQLKEDYIELDRQLREVNTENDALKRMLGLAIEELEPLGSCS